MCCGKIMVRISGGTLMLWGIIIIICAVTVTTGSEWVKELMPEEEGENAEDAAFADQVGSLGKVFEAMLYVFGVYTFVQGFLAIACCSGKCEGKVCYVSIFQVFQVILTLLTIVISIGPFSFWMISED
jgi:hypothetical protein